jgi:ligand-binding sensor domain-containing protein
MKQRLFKLALGLLVLALAGMACSSGSKATPVPPTSVPPTSAPPPTQAPSAVPTTPPPTPTTPPAAGVEPGWYEFTNGNYVREIALNDGLLYAATGGGAVVWNPSTSESAKNTVLDGLPTNDLLAVAACPIPDMRVIFGSEYGLTILDPVSGTLEQWDSSNSNMYDDSVESIDCDAAKKTLYIGYTWGLDVFNAADTTWKHLDEDSGMATDWVDQVAVIGGDTWVVSSFGVTQIKADGTFVPYTEDLGNIPDDNVEAVAGDASGNVWLAAFDGLMKFSNGQFKLYDSDSSADFPFLESFTGVAVDSKGMVWAGNYFGTVCVFDPAAEKCTTIYEDKDGMAEGVSDLIIGPKDEIFFGSDDGTGISRFDGSAWKAYLREELNPSNQANVLAQIPDGTILVGGDYGLMQFASSEADQPWRADAFDGDSVEAFFKTPAGIWFGYSSGASFYDYTAEKWTIDYPTGDPGVGIASGTPNALTVDGKGRLWVGTYSGLTVVDGSKYTFYDLLNQQEITDKWSPKSVYSVLYDGKNVWVGASGALYRFDEADAMTRYDENSDELPSSYSPDVYAMALDKDGTLLLAIDSMLVRYKDGKFSKLYEAESDITSLLVTDTGEWWLATYSDGVLHYDGSAWTQLTTKDGLPSNHFYTNALLLDDLGSLWFSAQYGGLARWVK